MHIISSLGTCGGYEAITPNTLKSITSTVRVPTSGAFTGMAAKAAIIQPHTHPVRYRIDGGNAEADVGMVALADTQYIIEGSQNVKNLCMIDTAAGASSVRVSVFF